MRRDDSLRGSASSTAVVHQCAPFIPKLSPPPNYHSPTLCKFSPTSLSFPNPHPAPGKRHKADTFQLQTRYFQLEERLLLPLHSPHTTLFHHFSSSFNCSLPHGSHMDQVLQAVVVPSLLMLPLQPRHFFHSRFSEVDLTQVCSSQYASVPLIDPD